MCHSLTTIFSFTRKQNLIANMSNQHWYEALRVTTRVLTLIAVALAAGRGARRAPAADPAAPTPGTSWVSQPVGMCHTSHSSTQSHTPGHNRRTWVLGGFKPQSGNDNSDEGKLQKAKINTKEKIIYKGVKMTHISHSQ